MIARRMIARGKPRAGVLTARILRGEKPADLPVQRSTKVELIVNLKTAKTLGVTILLLLLIPFGIANATEIERSITMFAGSPNGGLILTASALSATHGDLVIALTARYKLPAIYNYRDYVVSGGLIAYGPDVIDQHKRAAGYVDRILKGEKPADLPVQAPTKYELVINLKTAKALGLTIPESFLQRADEVIE